MAKVWKVCIRKQRNCTIRVAKIKALICTFVFAYAKCWFSHDVAQIALRDAAFLLLMSVSDFHAYLNHGMYVELGHVGTLLGLKIL